MAAAAEEVAIRVVAAVTRLTRLLRVRAPGLMPAYMYNDTDVRRMAARHTIREAFVCIDNLAGASIGVRGQ